MQEKIKENKLKEFFDKTGISQSHVARLCNMDLPRLNQLVSGKRGVSAPVAQNIARCLRKIKENGIPEVTLEDIVDVIALVKPRKSTKNHNDTHDT